ncbi:hypothetical protein WA026_021595 [Henosepilachna vigintioctopunctata]
MNYDEIFMKCSKANGWKQKMMTEISPFGKKSGKSGESSGGYLKKFLCTQKCVWEELDFISGTTINVDKVKKSELMWTFIKMEEMNAYLNCIKPIKVKVCEDIIKINVCTKAISSQS